MGFITWVKDMFNKFIALFNAFIKEAFDQTTKLLIGEFSSFAIATIAGLAATDLTNEAKRAEAFAKIKAEAAARGKTLGDSIINLLIELAVAKFKNENPTA
jgi:hypothetical protein